MRRTLEHAKKVTDIHQHLVTLYDLVLAIDAKRVLELGVRDGESTVALLEAVKKNGGRLVSVDIDPCEQARAMLKEYGISEGWEFHQGSDITFGEGVWDRSKFFDLIFVDTSHEYSHTKREIELFEPMVRLGGLMVFHDTVSFPLGVLKPIQEFLSTQNGYVFENHTHCHGLGILRKPT